MSAVAINGPARVLRAGRDTDEGDYEETYADLAAFAGREPAAQCKRIESITWHDADDWEATVGEQLRDTSTRNAGGKAAP